MGTDNREMPTWLNKDFVQTLLRDNENDESIVVQDITVRPAVGKGENYGSQLYRVAVNFTAGGKSEHRSLVVKSLPESELMVKLLLESGIFERESRMYHETLPAMYKLLPNSPDTAVETLATSAYKTTRPHTVVMDDLSLLGYKVAERHRGLGLRHTKLALRTMGKLHALSIGLEAQDHDSVAFYTEPLYKDEKREINKQFMEPGINLLASFIEKWPGYERFGDKLRNVDWVNRLTDMAKPKEGGIIVLNHGDGWTNNMLFKYDKSGNVESMKFVDFQICRYASPSMDLQYFMHTSPNDVVRSGHWDEVIEEYHKSLVETLKSIDCESKAFSLEKLKTEVQEKMLFGLFTACSILPIVLADPEDAPELSNMSEDTMEDNMTKADFGKSFNATRFRGVFEKLLVRFETLGII